MTGEVRIAGLSLSGLTEERVIAHVLSELRAGRGGWLGTLNLDICRGASRDPALQRLIGDASLLVPDGMPILWATWVRGTPVAERVTGASLISSLSKAAAREQRSIYLLGGKPGVPERAAAALTQNYPGLKVAGTDSPPPGFDATAIGIATACERLAAARPDIVYVGLGFPKQERLIAQLSPALPAAWFVSCGAAISFAAGALPRAPEWMQQLGLEWLFRLAIEPRRLSRRYLIDDLPFAVVLLLSSTVQRFERSPLGRARRAPGRRYFGPKA